jgi:ATPase subunit of ABC transporter with duplicated ATPase domains
MQGREVKHLLDVLGGVFFTLKELLEPHTIPREDWSDVPLAYDDEPEEPFPPASAPGSTSAWRRVASRTQSASGLRVGRRPPSRLTALGIPLEPKAGKMSGGQQAQVALTLALARRPQLLVLDEPMAMLDPLARHDFMAAVMTAVAEDGASVVLSSHVLAELERVADYLVLVSRGRVQVAGEVDDQLASHRVLTGPASDAARFEERLNVVHARRAEAQTHLLVRINSATYPLPRGFETHPVSLEELTLAYLRQPDAASLPGPTRTEDALRAEATR